MKDSLLMCDSTEGDGKAEIVMDYVMSWSLRHATDEYIKSQPILSEYCRYMLGVLLDITIGNDTQVESVKVWKEWQNIDLCVEAIIKQGETTTHYALLVENKYYSGLHDNQLQRYQAVFNAYYIKKNEEIKEDEYKWKLRRKLVSCFEYQEQVDKMYSKGIEGTDFVALPFYDLLCPEYWNDKTGKYDDSESEIFNEFWLRKW